jgi:hypothetical protein
MRAPGSPMRPLKLWVLAVMQVSPGPSMAGETRAVGVRRDHRTCLHQVRNAPPSENGVEHLLRCRGDEEPAPPGSDPIFRPLTTRAASAKSPRVPLAQQPTNACWIGTPVAPATGTELRITASGRATSRRILSRFTSRRSA